MWDKTGQYLGAGETGKWWQIGLLKTLTIFPCIQLLCLIISDWKKSGTRCIWDKEGKQLAVQEWQQFPFSPCGLLSPCPTSVFLAHWPHPCWREAAGREGRRCSRHLRTTTTAQKSSREGRSSLNLPSTRLPTIMERERRGRNNKVF